MRAISVQAQGICGKFSVQMGFEGEEIRKL
jgi:hypothetical protein